MNSDAETIEIVPIDDTSPSAGPAPVRREVLLLPLDEVVEMDRLRPVDQDEVSKIATSIQQVGQITPIEVALTLAGKYLLVAGAHRLAASRLAGKATIEAVVVEGSPDFLRLREIDENLYHHDLNPLDQAVFLAERAAIYLRMNPETKHGRNQHSGGVNKLFTPPARAFADDVAAKTGLHRFTVSRALNRARDIHPEALALIRGTWIGKKGSALDQLRDVPRDRQADVARALLGDDERRPRTVREARQRVLLELAPPPPDPVDVLYARINALPPGDRVALVERMAAAGWCSRSRSKAAVA